MDKEKALELASCAAINIKNMVNMMPSLKMHPLLGIVQMQIKACIEELEKVGDQDE